MRFQQVGPDAARILHKDLKWAVDISFACCPEPITCSELVAVYLEYECFVTVMDMMRALRSLEKEGTIASEWRFSEKTKSNVRHYYLVAARTEVAT